MLISEWAVQWGIPEDAVRDLRRRFIEIPEITSKATGGESEAQMQVRAEASECGGILMRNNVGACETADGRHIRWGLANDSKRMNERLKSSDLIGITPVKITPEMVGAVIGQFTAREMKKPGWVYGATDREQAQLRFLELIVAHGGNACFATGRGTL